MRSHDFPDRDGQHAIPYGIYDEQASAGFVNVGTGGNTAALAVESIRRWWALTGKDAYPHAARLLVTGDAGGSNGYRNRAWKACPPRQETGLEITVCHFPPCTSSGTRSSTGLFCQITLAGHGLLLTSYDVIINTIGAVTTKTGLTARAVLDENRYPTGLAGQRRADERHRRPLLNPPRLPRRVELHPAGPSPPPRTGRNQPGPRPGCAAPAPSATPPSPAPAPPP